MDEAERGQGQQAVPPIGDIKTVRKSRRGISFVEMEKGKLKEIAGRGGRAAHELGLAHEWTPEEAKRAGRLGGLAAQAKRRAAKAGGGQ